MLGKKQIIQLLCCLVIFSSAVEARRKRRGLANIVARKIISYIPEGYLSGSNIKSQDLNIDAEGECKNLYNLNEYFFNVYSNETEKYSDNLTNVAFESLVKYQLLRGSRDDLIERKSAYFKCKNRTKCFQTEEIFQKLNITNGLLTKDKFKEACPYLLYNNELDGCEYNDADSGPVLSQTEVWIIGLVFAGIVSLFSWNGLIVFPIIASNIYKRVLCFMIALAFSCMSTNSLLNYVPLADGFFETNIEDTNKTYFFKHLIVLLVIFCFFCFERCMKLFAIWKTKKRRVKKELEKRLRRASSHYDSERKDQLEDEIEARLDREEEKRCFKQRMLERGLSIDVVDINIIGNAGTITLNDPSQINDKNENVKLCCTSLTENLAEVRPIGWMAVFGDGLGNFIDGLSIGAAMQQGLLPGLTTALATWSSNIPQELGDFALLVRSGMTPFQALFYNYMSGNTAYIGCIIGIVFGENMESARWIFAISSGTTLFLSLGVMLPELNEEFEESSESFIEKCKITLIQISGMLIGYMIVIILNVYEESIEL